MESFVFYLKSLLNHPEKMWKSFKENRRFLFSLFSVSLLCRCGEKSLRFSGIIFYVFLLKLYFKHWRFLVFNSTQKSQKILILKEKFDINNEYYKIFPQVSSTFPQVFPQVVENSCCVWKIHGFYVKKWVGFPQMVSYLLFPLSFHQARL